MVIETQDKTYNTYTDRRRSPRWALISRIFYQMDGDTDIHESQSVNISATGMCFNTPELFHENTRVKMKIFLSDEAAVKVSGQVIWSRAHNGHYQAAIRFSDIDPHTQDLIIENAFESNRAGMAQYWFKGWGN